MARPQTHVEAKKMEEIDALNVTIKRLALSK